MSNNQRTTNKLGLFRCFYTPKEKGFVSQKRNGTNSCKILRTYWLIVVNDFCRCSKLKGYIPSGLEYKKIFLFLINWINDTFDLYYSLDTLFEIGGSIIYWLGLVFSTYAVWCRCEDYLAVHELLSLSERIFWYFFSSYGAYGKSWLPMNVFPKFWAIRERGAMKQFFVGVYRDVWGLVKSVLAKSDIQHNKILLI